MVSIWGFMVSFCLDDVQYPDLPAKMVIQDTRQRSWLGSSDRMEHADIIGDCSYRHWLFGGTSPGSSL